VASPEFRCDHGFYRSIVPCFECGDARDRNDVKSARGDRTALRKCSRCGRYVNVETLGPGVRCLTGCRAETELM
jgi:hypothetical protein